MATNAVYKRWNGTGWEIFHFRTSASQVGVTSNRKFITASTLVNGQAFTLGQDDSNIATVTITGAHTANGVTGSHNYIHAGENINVSLVALDAAAKAAYDNIPEGILTASNYATTLDSIYLKPSSQLDATKLTGKVPEGCLPDYLLGQLLYGGVLGALAAATLTTNAKNKLGVSNSTNTITLVNSTDTTVGYTSNEGIYYIVNANQTFAGLDLKVGDWLVATANGWSKVDNTDAVRTVKGINQGNNVSGVGDITLAAADVNAISLDGDDNVTGLKTFLDTGGNGTNGGILMYSDQDYNSTFLTFKCEHNIDPATADTVWRPAFASIWLEQQRNTFRQNIYQSGLHIVSGRSSENILGNIYLRPNDGYDNDGTMRTGKVYIGVNSGVNPDATKAVATIGDLNTALGSYVTTTTFNTAMADKVDVVAGSQLIETTKITSYDNHLTNTSNPHSVTKAQVGLGNVDNKSEATIKNDFTGSIVQGSTGFVTGGAVHTALAAKLANPDPTHMDTYADTSNHEYGFLWNINDSSFTGLKCVFEDDYNDIETVSKIGFHTGTIIMYSTGGVFVSSTYYDDMRTWGVYLRTDNVEGTKDVQFPNKSGTLAMLSDVPTVTVNNTQPTNPKSGDVWIDTSSN